jgi:hypothetical protein
MNTSLAKLKAFVRLDSYGNAVPGSLILRAKKPRIGRFLEIPKSQCCTPITVASIAAVANPTSIAVGATSTLTVTATLSDESTSDVTADATYSSSDEAVATVAADGTVTAVAEGTATITVSYQGKSTTVGVTITAA